MITEIRKNLYKIDQVLPQNPLQSLNVYVVKTEDKHLVIDMGFNCDECEIVLRKAFGELKIEVKDIDVLITHAHVDHVGTLDRFWGEFNRILTNPVTAEELDDYRGKTTAVMSLNNLVGGIPLAEQVADENTITYTCGMDKIHTIENIENESLLIYGDYTFKVLDLKGHSRGQLGLYEINEQFLLGGDHVLEGISPNISYWEDKFDALDYYLKNLNKIKDLSIKIIYPAHRNPIVDIYSRIDELIHHHHLRLEEIYGVLEEGHSAYEVATQIKWYLKNGNFKAFPPVQKWFATSEVLAHLEYLYYKGYLSKSVENRIYYYRRNKNFKNDFMR